MLGIVWALEKCAFYTRGAHDMVVYTDHAPLIGIEKKDLSTIGNQRLVRMLERTRGFCFQLKHITGVRNRFADALSRMPMENEGCADDFPRFGKSCMARNIHGVSGEAVPEHREDVLELAAKGLECSEYVDLVEFLKSGKELKEVGAEHPARLHASNLTVMGWRTLQVVL